MKQFALLTAALTLAGALAPAAVADEGMWQPHQLSRLGGELEELGLELAPETLSDLTGHPMNAVISLGGCTASFVSPQGLAVTNHHCAYRVLQYNSSAENNLLHDGFLARDRSQEIFAGPGSRILVTVGADDVSGQVRRGLEGLAGRQRFAAIEKRQKELVARCEEDAGHRCRVAAFHGGLEYYLVKQLEIRDVRLVYAPAGSVGRYGGDLDNWMWPRHTGDFTFYRAYVGRDGKPADFHEDNVPFRPRHHLEVSTDPLAAGDFVMAFGYPGRTNRYRLASEVEHQFGWRYPRRMALLRKWLAVIEETTRDRPDDAIKYAGTVSGLNNTIKNYQGMLDGFAKSDVLERKRRSEDRLAQWIASDEERRRRYGGALDGLRELISGEHAVRERELLYRPFARRAALLRAATTLYRLARERQKGDAEREPGFQERDLQRIRERLIRIDRTFAPHVDRAFWRQAILDYAAVPAAQHVTAFDDWFGIRGTEVDPAALDARLDEMYEQTELGDQKARLAWLEAAPQKLEASADPFVRLAVKLYPSDLELEEEEKERDGRRQALEPAYMEALIAFLDSQGKPVYPDANGTLRVTYGTVQGYVPRDAVIYAPFTTLAGIVEKDTGEEPFDSPPELLAAIRERRFGRYADPDLGSVAVNFLADLDTTGGSSGSPTLNGRGELVGLAFDGNYESIIADWDFLPAVTRSIHVDVRYARWVMDHLDGADFLLEEMGLEAAPDGE